MSRKQNIAWKDVLDLRVVRKLGQIINQRWNIGLGFLTIDGILLQEAETERFSTRRGLCDFLKEHTEGKQRCDNVGLTIYRLMKKSLGDDHECPRSISCICYAGLHQLVAPILIDNICQGMVIAGGYLYVDYYDALTRIQSNLTPMNFNAFEVEQALTNRMPRLSRVDEDYLRQLLELVAEEIATFQGEVACRERRQSQSIIKVPTRYDYVEIIGQSRPMQELYQLLDKVIASDSTVLIQGENGTGKELIARAIHFNSRRKERQFVVQNCSAFNDNLLDSELFGHKKGSFTGAISDKQGLFEVADGSTFFLDEIGDMSPSLQVKLLRVLQEGTFIPVGDTQPKKVDVRIIAATNRDLKRMVERGEFREDLYYRINVINIHVPPLRERKEDIILLIEHFLARQARGHLHRQKKLSKACTDWLIQYNWPGNIRELENEIERLVVLIGEEKLISEDLLSARIRQKGQSLESASANELNCLPDAVKDLERNMIYEVLRRNHWNKTRAAQELNISRRNLIRKVTKYNLDQRRAR
jgi:transcriptional regulator with PAS, ATPase and Fis domain